MMSSQDRLVPLGTMARILKVSSQWLKHEADSGRLPHLKADKQYLFEPRSITQILVSRAKKGESDDGSTCP